MVEQQRSSRQNSKLWQDIGLFVAGLILLVTGVYLLSEAGPAEEWILGTFISGAPSLGFILKHSIGSLLLATGIIGCLVAVYWYLTNKINKLTIYYDNFFMYWLLIQCVAVFIIGLCLRFIFPFDLWVGVIIMIGFTSISGIQVGSVSKAKGYSFGNAFGFATFFPFVLLIIIRIIKTCIWLVNGSKGNLTFGETGVNFVIMIEIFIIVFYVLLPSKEKGKEQAKDGAP